MCKRLFVFDAFTNCVLNRGIIAHQRIYYGVNGLWIIGNDTQRQFSSIIQVVEQFATDMVNLYAICIQM
mgnify:CR=1 FL=1